uniref:hypothetical protein n=1 Tax=Endozoicomonas sp. ONNA2 TaxID=2828741 RepID=UPI00214824E4
NHKGHKEHKGKEKLFFVLYVSFVVQTVASHCQMLNVYRRTPLKAGYPCKVGSVQSLYGMTAE